MATTTEHASTPSAASLTPAISEAATSSGSAPDAIIAAHCVRERSKAAAEAEHEAERVKAFDVRLAELSREQESARDGSHPELQRLAKILQAKRDARVASSTEKLKLELTNISQLHGYDLEEVRAQSEASMATIREDLKAEMALEIKRLQNLRSGVREEHRVITRNTRNRGGALEDSTLLDGNLNLPGQRRGGGKRSQSPHAMVESHVRLFGQEIEEDLDAMIADTPNYR